MLESIQNELEFSPLTQEEKTAKGILGRLTGPIASCLTATRNGRKYTDELWEKAFENPIIKEMFKNGGLPGELNHPVDRSETDATKIAIMMPNPPKKNKLGQLIASVDILDTPCGRIAYQLAKYGFKFGISSRGEGDVIAGWDGEEVVDPCSYSLEAFDLVLLPALETARLCFTESLDRSKKLKTALVEEIERSTADEQKVMKDTLTELNIDYSTDDGKQLNETYYGATYIDTEKNKHKIIFQCDGDITDAENMLDTVIPEPYVKSTLLGSMILSVAEADGFELVEKLDNPPERVDDIDVTKQSVAAEDDGADMIAELQESLKRQQQLEKQVKSLQLKLSVCYTKESRYSDKLGKANLKVSNQEIENKQLSEKLSSLTTESAQLIEQLSELRESEKSKDEQIRDLTQSLNEYRTRYATLQEKLDTSRSSTKSLNENLSDKSAKVKELTEAYTQLQKSSSKKVSEVTKLNEQLEEKNKSLVEELQEVQKDSQILKSQNNAKLEKAQKLVEKYKNIARTAVDNYIESQAARIGVTSSDIKSRLNESYSFKDIDNAIETMQQYKLNLNSLPFNTMSNKKSVKAKIRESKEPLLNLVDNTSYNFDDDIDVTLLNFTN